METSARVTYVQARSDAEQANSIAMWRAAQTVKARVPDAEEQAELLGALGLLDVARPPGLA